MTQENLQKYNTEERAIRHEVMKRAGVLLLAAVVFSIGVTNLRAEPMNVTATVLEVCELGTINDMAFGNLTPGSNLDVTATATIQWRCSNGTSADITINDGNNGDRSMDGPAATQVRFLHQPVNAVHFTL